MTFGRGIPGALALLCAFILMTGARAQTTPDQFLGLLKGAETQEERDRAMDAAPRLRLIKMNPQNSSQLAGIGRNQPVQLPASLLD